MLVEKNYFIEDLQKQQKNSLVKLEITDKLRSKIKNYAQLLENKNYPYDTLCWALAEFELFLKKVIIITQNKK